MRREENYVESWKNYIVDDKPLEEISVKEPEA